MNFLRNTAKSLVAFLVSTIVSLNIYACETCDTSISLKKTQWQCLEKQLDTLLTKELEPVFFTISQNSCGKNSSTSAFKNARATLPTPVSDEEAESFHMLMKTQLECLKENIAAIVKSGKDETFDFLYVCK